MRMAYADPPYLGCGQRYKDQHPEALEWDHIERHIDLIGELCYDFPDGWAMSVSSSSLQDILFHCPSDVRVMAWVKPFAVFKPNVNPAYAWEPVIVRGGRKRGRMEPTVRDWVSANITLRRGVVGAKPEKFCMWLFQVLNLHPEDEFVDIFKGSGAVGVAWAKYRTQVVIPLLTEPE